MKKTTLNNIEKFFIEHPEMQYLKENTTKAIEMLTHCSKQNKILVCGNGGSAADSEHIAGELLKSFMLKRKAPSELKDKLFEAYGEEGNFIADNLQMGIKCIPLTSFCAYNTAFANDCDPKLVFAQLVNALGVSGDTLIAISTSGNSKNVCYAAKVAKTLGLNVIGMTGESGGELSKIADILLNVPSNIVYNIQELHLPLYHLICMGIESEIFDE